MRILIIVPFLTALILACEKKEINETTSKVEPNPYEKFLDQELRPQLHFTPDSGWMNDPNGLVYFEGQYHMFYQYNPDTVVWSDMHWGHAVSRDLIHWEHKPIALYPDDMGFIFSGSAVVDWANSSNLGEQNTPPLVAIFTYDRPDLSENKQVQALAFSNDSGSTWQTFDGNPVLDGSSIPDFRDPKVFWYQPSQRWIMSLAVKDRIKFFQSVDLKTWQYISEFGVNDGYHEGVWECPDLIRVPVEGTSDYAWALLVSVGTGGERGSGTQYFIGDFDGMNFSNSHYPERAIWLDHGYDNYAGVTWSDLPQEDDRTIFIGWMNNWDYANLIPENGWRGAMTIPRSLTVFSTNNGNRIRSYPVEESKLLRSRSMGLNRTIVNGQMDWTRYLDSANHRIDMEFTVTRIARSGSWEIVMSNDLDQELIFGYDQRRAIIYVDKTNAGKSDFHENFAGVHEAQRLVSRDPMSVRVLVDNTSLEFFADVGEVVFTELIFPEEPYNRMMFLTPDDEVLVEGEFFHLNSIWKKN